MDRGVWQLRKLTLHYCVSDATSRGVRDFILGVAPAAPAAPAAAAASWAAAPATLAAFAAANPQLAIETRVHPNRAPRVAGEYADGSARSVDLKNRSAAEVAQAVQRARDSASGVSRRYGRPVATRTPTVQGAWDPSLTYEGFELREAKPEALPKSFAAAVAEAQRSAPAKSALR